MKKGALSTSRIRSDPKAGRTGERIEIHGRDPETPEKKTKRCTSAWGRHLDDLVRCKGKSKVGGDTADARHDAGEEGARTLLAEHLLDAVNGTLVNRAADLGVLDARLDHVAGGRGCARGSGQGFGL